MKRSGFQRKPLVRQADPTARLTIKPKKCKACRAEFFPARQMQTVCTPDCAKALVEKKAAREAEQQRLAEVRKDKARKEAIKTLGELKDEAQREINRFRRLSDRLAGHGCICCGQPLNWHSDKPGGEVDAGHYMSRGGSPELAFIEANINAQRKGCNRPGGTTRAKFREGMIQRHGLEIVEWLEGPHPPKRLRHDDYRQIRDTYRARANELEKKLR